MAREKWRQMRRHTDGTHTGATTTVGDTERLVQIEVANISAESTGTAQPRLRIEVGPVEVHLAAVLMHHGADLTDAGFKHAVGCLLYTSPSPRDVEESRMPSSA